MIKYLRIIFLLIPIFIFGQSNKDFPIRTLDKKVDYFISLVDSLKNISQTPGVGMAIVYEGNIIYEGGVGYANIATKEPITNKSLFAIGSVTKPMTGIIASKLEEKGLLDFEKPIKEYYPDFEVAEHYVTKNATLKDLLTHMTGVGKYDLLHYHNSAITKNDILTKLPFLESNYSLREKWNYNNIMYLVAGVVEEKVAQNNWNNLIQTEVFSPLDMNNTYSLYDDFINSDKRCIAYRRDGLTPIQYVNLNHIAPAGSVSSTPEDMAKFIQMLVNKGKVGEKKYLNESQFDFLTGTHAPFMPTRSISAGIGWITGIHKENKWIQKDGGIDGFNTKGVHLKMSHI